MKPPERKFLILDSRGNPIESLKAAPMRARMLAGGNNGYVPYDAADYQNPHMATWSPYLGSVDWENNPFRDRIVARVRDVIRNNGWALGAVNRILDNTIGATFRPISKPDHRALKLFTGIKGFDETWAEEFGSQVDACWRMWAEDQGKYCDVARTMNANQIFRLGFRHKLFDGDATAQIVYMPDRVMRGGAKYATCINLIDPDRLSNPNVQFDRNNMRGGVKINEDTGESVGYFVRRAHQGDWFSAYKSVTWDLIPRETAWGRPIFVHDYDRTRAGEHRGVSIFASILDRFRMLDRYDRSELDAAIINATLAAVVESPMDQEMVAEAMGTEIRLNGYQQDRAEFHKERGVYLGDSKIVSLFPGEKLSTVDSTRPSQNFADFEKAFIRSLASNLGMTEQQFSQDWTGVNFSSARAALLEVWKTTTRRRADFGFNFGMPIRCAVMEEFFEREKLTLPAGAPPFMECRSQYAACKWVGPGRGYPDPVADREGAILGMTAGLTTLEDEVSEGSGNSWEDVVDQLAIEAKRIEKLGLELPGLKGKGGEPGGSHDPKSPNYRSQEGAGNQRKNPESQRE